MTRRDPPSRPVLDLEAIREALLYNCDGTSITPLEIDRLFEVLEAVAAAPAAAEVRLAAGADAALPAILVHQIRYACEIIFDNASLLKVRQFIDDNLDTGGLLRLRSKRRGD